MPKHPSSSGRFSHLRLHHICGIIICVVGLSSPIALHFRRSVSSSGAWPSRPSPISPQTSADRSKPIQIMGNLLEPLRSNLTTRLHQGIEDHHRIDGIGLDTSKISLVTEVHQNGTVRSGGITDASEGKMTEYAFVSVISNEKYVDGAIVLALSLYNNSRLLQEGKCELVLMCPETIHPESLRRLKSAGFSRIRHMPSLAHFAPESTWKGTFDKLYLWSLVEYKMIAFFDADMLALDEPDSAFKYPLPNATFIGALGSGNKKYFQTGMMTILPNKETFDGLLTHFKEGVRSGVFRGLNARDGEVARSYFGPRFVRLSNYYSMYRNASQSLAKIKLFHFRGLFKPWFDRSHPPKFKASGATGAVEFGRAYRLWWEYYEKFHVAEYSAGREPLEGWGGESQVQGHPSTHVWMMRYSQSTYVQRLWSTILEERNVIFDKMTLRRGNPGASCNDVCARTGEICNSEGLAFTPINTCDAISMVLKVKCAACIIDFSTPFTPYYNWHNRKCFINYLHDPYLMPTCPASDASAKRLCVCLKSGKDTQKVLFTDMDQLTHRTPR